MRWGSESKYHAHLISYRFRWEKILSLMYFWKFFSPSRHFAWMNFFTPLFPLPTPFLISVWHHFAPLLPPSSCFFTCTWQKKDEGEKFQFCWQKQLLAFLCHRPMYENLTLLVYLLFSLCTTARLKEDSILLLMAFRVVLPSSSSLSHKHTHSLVSFIVQLFVLLNKIKLGKCNEWVSEWVEKDGVNAKDLCSLMFYIFNKVFFLWKVCRKCYSYEFK